MAPDDEIVRAWSAERRPRPSEENGEVDLLREQGNVRAE
jgi:hypothetical protein